jgi:RNA-binding protein
MRKELLIKAKALEPTARIGKSGITDTQIADIKKQLEKRKIIKIRFLQSFIADKDKNRIMAELAEKVNARIIQKIGFVIVLQKR